MYDVVGIICTLTFTNFGGVGFVLLSWERTWLALKNQSFFGYILVPAFFVYLTAIHPRIFGRKKVAKRE